MLCFFYSRLRKLKAMVLKHLTSWSWVIIRSCQWEILNSLNINPTDHGAQEYIATPIYTLDCSLEAMMEKHFFIKNKQQQNHLQWFLSNKVQEKSKYFLFPFMLIFNNIKQAGFSQCWWGRSVQISINSSLQSAAPQSVWLKRHQLLWTFKALEKSAGIRLI